MDESREIEQPHNDSVGYRKPPVGSRFKRGQSGNPFGRPRGSLNTATILHKALSEKVVINENGRRKTISKYDASVKQLVNKAASGDMRAIQQLLAVKLGLEQSTAADLSGTEGLNDLDKKVMLNMLNRYEKLRRDHQHENESDRASLRNNDEK